MIVTVDELSYRLQYDVKWQETPETLYDDDYYYIIRSAIRRLYIDTARSDLYEDLDEYDFEIDEQEYIILCAKLYFYDMVKASLDQMVSYTTNALSITGGDKPYKNIKETRNELEAERIRTFNKMDRFVHAGVDY